ncbi:ribonuclease III [Xylaria nigripes]|nr:ribonuclease III [Xylaria nigripes]
MSKRSFQDFSTIPSDSLYLSVLGHANALLKVAESLKKDLERLGQNTHDEKIISTLKRHNVGILSAVQTLSQDETTKVGEAPDRSHKTQKLNQCQEPSHKCLQSVLAIPHPVLLTKWTPQDVPKVNELPPLPLVSDPLLEKAARTHSGSAGPGEMNYERLEWIGDAYLYLVSSAFIYQTFPNLPPGRCSQLRERLIKNEALSEFTLHYGLEKRAILPSEFDPQGRQSRGGGASSASKKERKKILGDLLEAYTAAVVLDDADGLLRVVTWLKPMWGSILKREISDEYKTPVVQRYSNVLSDQEHSSTSNSARPTSENLPPKVVLAQIIGTKGVTIFYRDEGGPKTDKNSGLPWYTVGAYYDGLGEKNLSLGYGSGLSKKEAGANAALRAMENKKLIKRLKSLKDEFNAQLPKPQDSRGENNAAP